MGGGGGVNTFKTPRTLSLTYASELVCGVKQESDEIDRGLLRLRNEYH